MRVEKRKIGTDDRVEIALFQFPIGILSLRDITEAFTDAKIVEKLFQFPIGILSLRVSIILNYF